MKRKRPTQDSLELFLDAICNMFGAFAFIMILVVALIRVTTDDILNELQARDVSPVSPVSNEKLNVLKVELERETAKYEALEKGIESEREYVLSLVDPEKLERYKETLDALEQIEREQRNNAITQEEIERLQKRNEELTAETQRLNDELGDARRDAESTRKEYEKTKKDKERTASNPVMRSAGGKIEAPLVLKFGRLYFLRRYDSYGRIVSEFNDADFLIVSKKRGSVVAEPKPWRGIDLNQENAEEELEKAFKRFSKNDYYFAVVCIEDSYEEYNALAAFLKKRDYSLSPVILKKGSFIADRGGSNRKTQ